MSQGWEVLVPAEFAGDVVHYAKPDGEGGLIVRSSQDVTSILANAEQLRNNTDGYTAERERRHVATIPAIVRQYFLTQEGWDPWRPDLYPEKMAQLLNDSDWAWLRTSSGRVAAVNGELR